MSEERYDLPEGWEWRKISDIAKVTSGYAFKSKEFTDKGIPVIRISNLQDSGVTLHDAVRVNEKYLKTSERFMVKNGDVLIAMSGATTGKTGRYFGKDKVLLNQRVGRFDLSPQFKINNNYFWYFIESVKRDIIKKAWGCAQPNISSKELEDIDIPIPPINEQDRIVVKIENFIKKAGITKQSLAKIPPILKKFRQSVLAKAFSGEFTEDWRAKQKDLEAASKLLERIREERKKLLGKKYKEPEPIDTSDLPELPEGWEWVKIEGISSIVTKGATPTSYRFKYQNKGILFVKVENISDYMIRRDTVTQFISREAHQFLKRSQLQDGDILFSIAGTIGRVCLVRKEDIPANTNQALAIIRIPSGFVYKDYLLFYLSSFVAQKIASAGQRGVGMVNISLEDVKNIAVALPPRDEQEIIVKKIRDFLAQADAIEKSVKIALSHCEKLNQSILAKAFRGEFVS